MNYRELEPRPELAPFVKCYWVLEASKHGGAGRTSDDLERVYPDGCPELIFHRGDRFHLVRNGSSERQSRALVFGQLERRIELRRPPRVETIGVRLRHAGLKPLLRIDAYAITGTWRPLAEVAGTWGAELEAAALAAPDCDEAVRGIEEALRARLPAARAQRSAAVDAAIESLTRSGGHARIEEVARHAGVGTRQLERLFRAHVGLTPKRLAGILRLQEAFALLAAGASPPLIEVAQRCGYFDQSHFIRDFRRVTGLPPSRFLRDDGVMARLFVVS
jgi:AraC-like DNA-binding protein